MRNISSTWRGLAIGTGQFVGWIRYALVALAGALIDIGLFYALVEQARWRVAAALPLAIEAALLSNFVCSEAFTFCSPPTHVRFAVRASGKGRLARYERICAFPARPSISWSRSYGWRGVGEFWTQQRRPSGGGRAALNLHDERTRHLADVGKPSSDVNSSAQV